MAAILFLIQDSKVYATLKGETKLKENKSYYYDLDGDGKKEKIKYIVAGKDYNLKVALYINGVKKYSQIFNALNVQYSISDLDLQDKKLDLFLMSTSDSYSLEYALFQQYSSNTIKTIKTINGVDDNKNKFGYTALYRINGLAQIKGDGSFSIIADSPIYFSDIGSYFCYVPFNMKEGKISYKKVKSYTLTNVSQDYLYTVNKDIVVYEKADNTSKRRQILKKEDTLNIKKFIISKNFSENNKEGYAYIIDSKGNKGWIYLSGKSGWENPMFKIIPAWG